MSMYEQEKVAELMTFYGHPVAKVPTIPDLDIIELTHSMFFEEAKELHNAIKSTIGPKAGERLNALTEVADAVGDCLVTLLNIANVYGIPVREVFDEIMRSNLSKIGENGQLTKNKFGKVQKPITYSPPNIKDILKDL